MNNGNTYNPVTGWSGPRAADTPRESTSPHVYDGGAIDTAAEARNWQARISRLEQEANDPTSTPGMRGVAQHQLAQLKKATPYQVAQWRAIDEARAKRGGR